MPVFGVTPAIGAAIGTAAAAVGGTAGLTGTAATLSGLGTMASGAAGLANAGMNVAKAVAGGPKAPATQVGGDNAVKMGAGMGGMEQDRQAGAQLTPVGDEEEQRKPNPFAGGLPGGGGWTA